MSARQNLINLLQLAYSAELAAALAYRGHWHSVSGEAERDCIREIEREELHHRRQVGQMLVKLGARPRRTKEIKAVIIGRALAVFCHLGGWLAPMYGAGRLESRNVREYEMAARYARSCGSNDLIESLLTMAEVEWEHEWYFRARVESHRWARRLPMWRPPPPKETIRASFAAESGLFKQEVDTGPLPGTQGSALSSQVR